MAYGVLNMSPDLFWSLTYNEFCLAMDGYKYKVEKGMSESWWTAHLTTVGHHQPKKFPKLSQLLNPEQEMSEKERQGAKDFLNSIPKTRKLKDT